MKCELAVIQVVYTQCFLYYCTVATWWRSDLNMSSSYDEHDQSLLQRRFVAFYQEPVQTCLSSTLKFFNVIEFLTNPQRSSRTTMSVVHVSYSTFIVCDVLRCSYSGCSVLYLLTRYTKRLLLLFFLFKKKCSDQISFWNPLCFGIFLGKTSDLKIPPECHGGIPKSSRHIWHESQPSFCFPLTFLTGCETQIKQLILT